MSDPSEPEEPGRRRGPEPDESVTLMSITRDEAEDLLDALRSEGIDARPQQVGQDGPASDPGVGFEIAAKLVGYTPLGPVMWALTDEPAAEFPRWHVLVPEQELDRATRIAERMFPDIRMAR